MARLEEWNFFNRNVQSGLTEGQFLSSASTVICAGPPFLAASGASNEGMLAGGNVVYPIGLIDQWSISQNLTVIPLSEAGSYRRYTVTGPATGQVALGRSLYHGPSLLRVLYAYYRALDPRGETPVYPLIDNEAANVIRNPKNAIFDAPGYENGYFNLASDLFTQPIGLLLYIQDVNRESYSALYLEQVHVGNHSLQSGASSVVLSESTQCLFARAKPVKLANPIPLMGRFQDSGVITTAGTFTNGEQRLAAATQSNL